LKPAPARTTSFTDPTSSIGSVTFVPLTTNTSGASFLIASTSASSFRSGWYEVSQPIASKPSRPDCSNLSAIKTLIVFPISNCRLPIVQSDQGPTSIGNWQSEIGNQIVCISKPSLSLG